MSGEERIFRDVVEKAEAERNRHHVRANELTIERDQLRQRLNSVAEQRDAAELRLRQLAPILREAHDELIALKTHRTLLVAALLGHAIEIEAGR